MSEHYGTGKPTHNAIKPQIVRTILERWNEGESGKMIGDDLGMTRSSVLGVLKRLRDSGTEMRRKAEPKSTEAQQEYYRERRKAKKSGTWVPKAQRSNVIPMTLPKKPVRIDYSQAPKTPYEAVGIGIMDLSKPELQRECRYIVSDDGQPTVYCGCKTLTSSWCAHHAARVYAPRESKPKAPYNPATRQADRRYAY